VIEQAASFAGVDVQVGPELFALLMVFVRITGALHTAPLIGTNAVPVQARVGLGVLLALVVAPMVAVESATVSWSGPKLALMLGSELLLGLGMGFAASCVLALLDVLGTFIGVNSQLAIAMQFDPLSGTQQVITTRLVQAAGFLLFLSMDLHHQIVYGLVDSFAAAPPGTGVLAVTAGVTMSEVMAVVLLDSMRIAMPVVAAVLILNLVAALVTRFAQQMNIYFSVGLPANAAAGLMATALAIPALAVAVYNGGSGLRELMLSMIGG
jgi:flagellar biosynthesis protein FliR